MADLTPDEISEGKKQLSGPRIVFWILFIFSILGAIGSIVSFFSDTFNFVTNWAGAGSVWPLLGSIFGLLWALLFVILYGAEIAGINSSKHYAVGLGRFLIIWMMIFGFPIGTIIGAIIWRRFSHPAAQKYLNYA
jgi:hypothetical protein